MLSGSIYDPAARHPAAAQFPEEIRLETAPAVLLPRLFLSDALPAVLFQEKDIISIQRMIRRFYIARQAPGIGGAHKGKHVHLASE